MEIKMEILKKILILEGFKRNGLYIRNQCQNWCPILFFWKTIIVDIEMSFVDIKIIKTYINIS